MRFQKSLLAEEYDYLELGGIARPFYLKALDSVVNGYYIRLWLTTLSN